MFEKDQKDIDGFKIIDTKEKLEVEAPSEEETVKKKKKPRNELLNWIILIVVSFGLAKIIHHFVFTPVTVEGDSMMTTIFNNDKIFLIRFGSIERGNVVVFDIPTSDKPLIKRVIGVPGDNVRMENYKLYINDEFVEEPYLDTNPVYTGIEYSIKSPSFTLQEICEISKTDCLVDGEIKIPKGYYLVLGDNRNNSYDSRDIGLISEAQIQGRALFVIYPFKRFGKTFGD